MASIDKTQIFQAPVEKIYQVLKDYESYPDFMDGVSRVSVLSSEGSTSKVEYHLNLIKKFNYIVQITEKENEQISWTFDSGDLFKKNDGSWTLRDLGDGTTEVTYKLDLDFKVMVPSMVSKKLVSSNLPKMLKAVEDKANRL